ncbi:MAG: Hsp20/alpha crystallin family protein [Methanomicrobia archaeon]|nr:Hsp20/alpha crystallin family protein [Methanomicrobia archaeon]MCK4433002.1 Hsp20/alpha crystallin family protein [Methanomicrobia archaeon]
MKKNKEVIDMDIFDEIRRIQEEMDRMFSSIYTRPSLPSKRIKPFNYREPLLDVIDKGKELLVQAELPGISKGDIEIDLNENTLTIKASKKKVVTEEKEGYFYQERGYAGYYRTVPLPTKVDPDKIKAKYNNGVLEIILPKISEEVSKKKIKIE